MEMFIKSKSNMIKCKKIKAKSNEMKMESKMKMK